MVTGEIESNSPAQAMPWMEEDQVPSDWQVLVGDPVYPELHVPFAVMRAAVAFQLAFPVVESTGQGFTTEVEHDVNHSTNRKKKDKKRNKRNSKSDSGNSTRYSQSCKRTKRGCRCLQSSFHYFGRWEKNPGRLGKWRVAMKNQCSRPKRYSWRSDKSCWSQPGKDNSSLGGE